MITKDEFKTFVGITLNNYDNVIDQVIAGAKKFIESHCNNVLIETSLTEYFSSDEAIENNNDIFLQTRINISDLKVYYNSGTESVPTWVEEERANYQTYLEEGRIALKSVRGSDLGGFGYKVTYKAGYTSLTMPEDLKLACLKLSSAIFNKRKAEGLSSESLEGASVNFAGSMSDEIKLLLNKYKSFTV